MTNAFALPRKLLIFGIILPLAALIGYLLSNPDFQSLLLVGLLASVLSLPIFLRWHHVILVVTWNLSMTLFFLPGNPPMWMLAGVISLAVTVLNRILDKEKRLQNVPALTWALLLLGLVVLFTMKMTGGGFALRSMGEETYGGKKYYMILFAVAAYFALSFQRIPIRKAKTLSGIYFLSGLTPVMSNILYALGPSAWILYALFPVDWALNQAVEDMRGNFGTARIGRVSGIGFGGAAVFYFLLLRFGIRGILDWTKPWRFITFALVVVLSLFSGFRSVTVMYFSVFVLQFFLEGLHRTRLLPLILVSGTLSFAAIIPFANKLPLSVQRCLTLLPLDFHPAATMDAKASTDWRLRMWEVLIPEIPKYLFVGKGYTASAADYYLTYESMKRGLTMDFETSLVAGDYHNGPLSILIPFGIFGMVAFVWFVVAGARVLYMNFRYGDPELKTINTLLFSFFTAKVAFFFFVFGAIHSDLLVLAGAVGLGISLNGTRSLKPAVASSEVTRGVPLNMPARGQLSEPSAS
jgi:hypothetical protein